MNNLNLIILKYVIYSLIFVVISLKLKSIHRMIIVQQMIYPIKNQLIIDLNLQIILNRLVEAAGFNTNQSGYIVLVNTLKIHTSQFIN
jgi:hypothetical protein